MSTVEPATTPEPPYYAVIFTTCRSAEPGDGYDETAAQMESLARQQPGFLGFETACERAWGSPFPTGATRQSIAAWKRNSDHAFAQWEGRTRWYDRYELRVARVERAYGFRRDAPVGRVVTLPNRIEFADAVLRPFELDDAEALATAVWVSLEHLQPWMPWADSRSAEPGFQRERLRALAGQAARREEWQYGLFDLDEKRVLGSFGLMTRQGPGTIEIGYWVHVDEVGRGLATRATAALTEVARRIEGIRQVIIRCDEANVRSGAIPRRLGYTLDRIETRTPEAPGESGRLEIWVLTPKTAIRDLSDEAEYPADGSGGGFVDAAHDVVVEAGDDVERAHVLAHLRRVGSRR